MPKNKWVVIEGWENYSVSAIGEVKNNRRGTILAQFKDRRGKLRVNLWKNNKQTQVYVHRIIAKAFIPNPKAHKLVRHLDDVADNNQLDNLAWGTSADNALDMLRNGNHAGKNKTHCKYGHEYTQENTYVDGVGGRRCRECNKLRARNYWFKED